MDFWQSLFEENLKSYKKPLFFTKRQYEMGRRINDFYMTVAKNGKIIPGIGATYLTFTLYG